MAYVFSDNVIEHVDLTANRTLLREAFRVLRPGGRMRLATPDIGALVNLYRSGHEAGLPLRDDLVAEGYSMSH